MEAADRFGRSYAGLPFTVFVSSDRQILYTHSGELHREQLDDILSVVDERYRRSFGRGGPRTAGPLTH